MLSLSKLVLLVLVVVAVWFGWRWYRRVAAIARTGAARRAAGGRRPAPAAATGGATAATIVAEDMEKCPECGAYVAPHAAVSCGRTGCPYGR